MIRIRPYNASDVDTILSWCPAYYCYKAVGFNDVVFDTTDKYCIQGEEWKCKELIMENR